MNKVQKIREEVEKIAKSINPFIPDEDGKNSDYEAGKLDAATQILQIIDSLEEPVSNPIDFEKELYKAFGQVKDFTLGMRIAKRFYDMGKNNQEPVSEKKCMFTKDSYTDEERKVLCEDCKEKCEYSKKENLWKPADGDDLPEIDREVVAFQEIFPTDVDVPSLLKIVIAHRPNTEGYDGKSITTGQVEHYTPKTYDKGGWNIPDVKYWLDARLPYEEK